MKFGQHFSPPDSHFSPQLFTIHYSLLTIHYSLFTIHSSLFTLHYSLFTLHYSLFTIHYSLFTSIHHIKAVLNAQPCPLNIMIEADTETNQAGRKSHIELHFFRNFARCAFTGITE